MIDQRTSDQDCTECDGFGVVWHEIEDPCPKCRPSPPPSDPLAGLAERIEQRPSYPMDPVAMVNRRVDKNLAGYSDAFAERDRLKAAEAAEKAQRSSEPKSLAERLRYGAAQIDEKDDGEVAAVVAMYEAANALEQRASNPVAVELRWLRGLFAEREGHGGDIPVWLALEWVDDAIKRTTHVAVPVASNPLLQAANSMDANEALVIGSRDYELGS